MKTYQVSYTHIAPNGKLKQVVIDHWTAESADDALAKVKDTAAVMGQTITYIKAERVPDRKPIIGDPEGIIRDIIAAWQNAVIPQNRKA